MEKEKASSFYFIGNTPCLDFVNTLLRPGDKQIELLGSFADLISWLVHVQLLQKGSGSEALAKWNGTLESESALEQARALRAALLEIVVQITDRQLISQTAIQSINALLALRAGHMQLVHEAGIFHKRFYLEPTMPFHLLVPLAEAAGDFLCHADPSLIKQCHNPLCSLYFYDTTRSHTRRWCSMSVCGNRSKAALHYRKARQIL